MNGKGKLVEAVADWVGRLIAMLALAAFASTAAHAQTSGFVYVANAFSNNVSAYTISGATGALTPVTGSPFPAGSGPRSVAVDPTGQFAYVANSGSGNVSAYTINGAIGHSARLALPGGLGSFLRDRGPDGPVRLCGKLWFQQRLRLHH